MLIINFFTWNQHPQLAASATLPQQGKRHGMGCGVERFLDEKCDWTIGRNFEMKTAISYLNSFKKRPAF